MNRLFEWIRRIPLLPAFLVLSAAHLLLYFSLRTENAFVLALSAALIDTGVIALLQVVAERMRSKGR